MIGGAQMSEMHCNFMINTGDATADDLEDLGETCARRVLETFRHRAANGRSSGSAWREDCGSEVQRRVELR